MLDENHSPDHWVFSYPLPDGLGRAELKWTWQSNVTDILGEWQFVDVAGHNGLHRCRLCPLRESNEQPWLHGWPELSKGPCGLTSWWAEMSVGSQHYLAQDVSHFMRRKTSVMFSYSQYPDALLPRVEVIYRFIRHIIWLVWVQHSVMNVRHTRTHTN